MAQQGSDPTSRVVDDHLKDESNRMPPRGLTREDTDKRTPA